jgi:16S rRNA processing protein RimM
VAVGRIGKPHGVKGWVTVHTSTDEPERRFAIGARVFVDGRADRVAEARIQAGRVTLRLDSCADREDAESLRGTWLEIDVDPTLSPEDPDEFYDHQLVGLSVLVGQARVGVVAEVLHLPAQDLLAVDLESGRRVLVPFVGRFVSVVDVDRGVVEVDPVEGLLEDAD